MADPLGEQREAPRLYVVAESQLTQPCRFPQMRCSGAAAYGQAACDGCRGDGTRLVLGDAVEVEQTEHVYPTYRPVGGDR